MTAGPIRVEIVTPVHNRREITLQCLRSLSRIERGGLDVHIVVVDDGSSDGTSDAIRKEFPHVEVVVGDGTLFFTEGTNTGIRAALRHDPKYILLINDDSVFDSRFLSCLVETAEGNQRSVVGPMLLLWDQPHKVFQTSPVWDTWHGGWRHWYQQTVWTVPNRPWKVDIIVGNCLLVPADAIRECGLMDSKHFPNFGDAEYTPRLRKKGWTLLIDPRSRVFCQPNTQFQRLRSLPLSKMVSVLFFDLKSAHNLRWRFFSHWYSAPNRLKAIAAFSSFLVQVPFGRSNESSSLTSAEAEPKLADLF
jgi:GT2 family glycosyltransferase